ncbi:MAG TPA: ATP-binding protein [Syntrophomonas sp.]|nr:ATP-binding protein [Syntrophomonas sp.]
MKNKPLALQIWLVIAGISLGVSMLFMALLPWTLKGFFTRQMYGIIHESQELYLANEHTIEFKDLVKWDQQKQQLQSVQHMVFLDNGEILLGYPSAAILPNMSAIFKEAASQQSSEQRYSRQLQDERMYYIIRKGELGDHQAYLLSYMWESYQNDLVKTLLARIIWVIAAVLVLSWLPAFWLARYLSRPLTTMEEHVRRIADRDWYEPLPCDRRDEIGQLAQSIERMRERLVEQDESQQTFLQRISHELKTPVMVIRSYAQAIADNIFPRGGLEGSIQVIDEEAERLEKKVRDLLYLNKINYLTSHLQAEEEFVIEAVIQQAIDLLRWQRSDLVWKLEGQGHILRGDSEQWKVAIENLLDNQIRYAQQNIDIKVTEQPAGVRIRIWNDGPPIDERQLEEIFKEYQMGDKGRFGLGLSIAQQVVIRHNGKIWAVNEDGGAAFYIEVPGIA